MSHRESLARYPSLRRNGRDCIGVQRLRLKLRPKDADQFWNGLTGFLAIGGYGVIKLAGWRKKQNLLAIGLLSTIGLVLIFSFQNCNSAYQPLCATCGSAVAANAVQQWKFALSQPSLQSANLGTTLRIPIVITGDNEFSGTVNLSLRASDILAIDPTDAITFALDHSSVNLSPGTAVPVNILMTISTMAPSFASQTLHLDATSSSNSSFSASAIVPLKVNAIYDVTLHGPAVAGMPSVENWSVAPGQTVSFVSHSEGLVVRFNNYSMTTHLIHSSGGPIAHESLSIPYMGTTTIGLPGSTNGTTVGGIYSVTVPGGTTEMTSQVYCHFDEPASQSRNFQFNVPTAPTPTPTPVADPNARFSVVNSILQTNCIGCHTGSSPPAGINLTTYAGTLMAVTKGNASISELYNAVKLPNPAMPKGGTPLTATQVTEIQDWINAGALNN